MNKYCVLLLTLISVGAVSGCYETSTAPNMLPISEFSKTVSIILGPNTSKHNIDNVSLGAVSFSASIENHGDKTITIAPPTLCFPADYQPGEKRSFKDSHGKSEILLKIVKSNGKTIILREGPHFFEADTPDNLMIPPGESKKFYLGWFFLSARGMWEDNAKAATVFKDKGQYKAQLLYRNLFLRAVTIGSSTNKSRFINVWTGEILSNEVTVEIE